MHSTVSKIRYGQPEEPWEGQMDSKRSITKVGLQLPHFIPPLFFTKMGGGGISQCFALQHIIKGLIPSGP